MNVNAITPDLLISILKDKEYDIFTGYLNVNIILIRSKDIETKTFNDLAVIMWQSKKGNWNYYKVPVTVDPSSHYLLNPINPKGTAIVPLGQHKRMFRLGFHKGYEALVQARDLNIIRDIDKNDELTELAHMTIGTILSKYTSGINGRRDYSIYKGNKIIARLTKGMFGINFHRASRWKILRYIGLYSAGCTVVQSPYDFSKLMDIFKKSARLYGNSFTATYISEYDVERALCNSDE